MSLNFAVRYDHLQRRQQLQPKQKILLSLRQINKNGNKNASGNKPLDVRRERNRLSAKMSRLRKRVRLEFLEKTAINLKAQIDCLRQHLGAVNAAK